MSTVSPFISAMDASAPSNNKTLGENGSPEYTASGVKDARVALFFALVRGLPSDRLQMLLKDVFKTANTTSDQEEKVEAVADTFILAFQTRNCRGGKGERDLFYTLLSELSVDYPQTVSSLLSMIPHYGSYKDWFQLVDLIQDKKNTNLTNQVRKSMTPMVDKIFDLAKNQLIDDARILHERQKKSSSSSSSSGGLSLLAKWAPREKKQYAKQAKQLAKLMFPDSQTPKKDYRKLVSELNAAINTVETKMSSNKWDKIDFGSEVPSVCLMKNRKAFMNEEVKGSPPLESENDTGNRHPDNEVRVSCRKRLRDALVEKDGKKLKGRQLFPHEIASKFMNSGYSYGSQRGQTSELEKEILASQWKDIREGVKESMVKVSDQGSSPSPPGDKGPPSVDLGKLVSLVDVSGSMGGTPMEVAIALGILTSELASPEFADRCLTFSATPEWVDLSSLSLVEKVERMQRANWGMNTDFEAAIEKILDIAVTAKLKPDDIPNLIVFSDMQFDQARMQDGGYGGRWGGYGGAQRQEMATEWETHHEKIVRRFKESGLRVCGKEWPAPHIIYWNLRGDTTGFPAQADTPGVTMLSGFSPSLMKLVLSGEPLVMEDVETGEKKQRDPYTTLRAALDDKDYDKVRGVLDSSEEGVLKLYEKKLEPEPLESEGTDEGDDWEMVKP